MAKSEWVRVGCSTEREKAAAKSWFAPFCDDKEAVEAAILMDAATDLEKKFRVKMRRPDGRFEWAIRQTLSGGRLSISFKPIPAPPAAPSVEG